MTKTIYANAYKEVLEVINNLIEEDYKKIPKEYIVFLENNCNINYEFVYDESKPFNEQKLLKETQYILFGLFEKFCATEKQKRKIKLFKQNYFRKLENDKIEHYNTENYYENYFNEVNSKINTESDTTALVKENSKEGIIKRILNKIKKILNAWEEK